MTRVLDIPANEIPELNLEEGDTLTGQFRDGVLHLIVSNPDSAATPSVESETTTFAERWRGKFSELLDADLSDDPRAQYLMEKYKALK